MGKSTLVPAVEPGAPVQRKPEATAAPTSPAAVTAAADRGVSGAAGTLPHLDQIQRSFGKHDVSHVKAHTDGAAAEGTAAMGAQAFARGDRVAFAGTPDLHTAAHEAAHVVQQTGGVQLAGGVGRDGDEHEAHADAVADRVVRGESAEPLLDRYAGGGAATGGTAVQQKPIADPKRGAPFYEDDKRPALKLRLAADAGGTKDFHVRNQLQPLYWKSETEDAYYQDAARTSPLDLDTFLSTHRFGAWLETYQETLHEHAKIDKVDDQVLPPDEKARRKNAISMYMLQEFIVNALYRADELTHLDYQASPFNYQEKSQYARSFATSYVKQLQDVIGKDYQAGKLMLTRDQDFHLVLDKFFEVARVTVENPVPANVVAEIGTTIKSAASYVYDSDKDLSMFWDVSGNTQAFIDVTPVLAAKTAQEQKQITERIGRVIKRAFSQAVAKELARMEADQQGKGGTGFETELGGALGAHVAVSEDKEDWRLIKERNKGNANTNARTDAIADRILEDPVGRNQFKTWLAQRSKKKQVHREFIEAVESDNLVLAKTKLKGFVQDVYDIYLKSREVDATTLQEPDAEAAFKRLAPKAERVSTSASSAVVTGGVVTLEAPGKQYQQPGVIIDDPTMDMAVKTAINKSGNVPTANEASRKLLSHEELQKIVLGVLDSQGGKGAKKQLDAGLAALRQKIVTFDAKVHPSIVPVKNHLAATKQAFEALKQQFASDTEAESLEARAAIKLITESGALEDGRLPDFVLQQLARHMQDAIANRARIEDHVRSIQGMHEAVILALELDGKPRDTTFAYGAPQHISSGSTKDDYFQGAHVSDYGLKAFSQVYDAAVAQLESLGHDDLDIVAFYNIYFELADKLRATRSTSKGSKVEMETPSSVDDFLSGNKFGTLDVQPRGVDVVMVDIHPNDATKAKIVGNDVSELLHKIFEKKAKEPSFKLTLIVDITLNHPGEPEVAEIREAAQRYIATGQLNLVFVQSMAKFPQLGMDKASGGLVLAYNDRAKWQKFNETLAAAHTKDKPDPTAEKYLQALFKHADTEQKQYLERVRANTKQVHEMLAATFDRLDIPKHAIQIAENVDDGSCYVALRYDEFLAKIYPPEKAPRDGVDELHEFNASVLEQGINELLRRTGLPVAMRFSFGFPVSNLGETGHEVRFTIGIEGKAQLQKYVDVLAYMNGVLAKKLQGIEDQERSVPTGKVDRFDPLAHPDQRAEFLRSVTDPVNNMQDLQQRLNDLLKPTL